MVNTEIPVTDSFLSKLAQVADSCEGSDGIDYNYQNKFSDKDWKPPTVLSSMMVFSSHSSEGY